MSDSEFTLASIHIGVAGKEGRQNQARVQAELDGLAGDKFRGFTRVAESWDQDPTGGPRRNERQWSAVSREDLATIAEKMDLAEPLAPETLGANLCFEGAPGISLLAKGSKLVFPSGAVLLVEEETLPCAEMGDTIADLHTRRAGGPVQGKFFPKLALGLRGTLGIVDVPGELNVGDKVSVRPYALSRD